MNAWVRMAMASLLALGLSCATFRDKGERLRTGVTDAVGAPRKFALLVGIDTFDDERFSSLKWAEADAIAMGQALTGFDDVRVLTGPAATLRANIVQVLHELGQRASNPHDTLVVYLSSHGSLARFAGGSLQRFIVTHDTRLDVLAETALSIDALKRELERLPARRKALILALCHSGKGKSAVSEPLLAQLNSQKQTPPSLQALSEGMVVMTACAFGETAQESDALGHDIYTAGLLSAMRHGDRDGDGAVTALEAHDFAREATWASTEGQQRPTLEAELVGRDPILLSGAIVREPGPVVQSYSAAAEGLQLRVDGQVKGRLPGGIGVAPGPHRLVLEKAFDGTSLFETDIEVRQGERIDLSDVLPRPSRWQFTAGGIVETSLLTPVAQQVWPLTGGVLLGIARDIASATLRLQAGYTTGAGQLQGIDETLPFRSHFMRLEAAGVWKPSRRWGLGLGASLGWLMVIREVRAPGFLAAQSAGGPVAQLRAEWAQPINSWVGFLCAARFGWAMIPTAAAPLMSPVLGLELGVQFGL